MAQRPKDQHDVLIAQDAGVAKARRIMANVLRGEEQARNAAAVPVRAATTQRV